MYLVLFEAITLTCDVISLLGSISAVHERTEFAYPDEEGSDDDDDDDDDNDDGESLEDGDRLANWVKDEVWPDIFFLAFSCCKQSFDLSFFVFPLQKFFA